MSVNDLMEQTILVPEFTMQTFYFLKSTDALPIDQQHKIQDLPYNGLVMTDGTMADAWKGKQHYRSFDRFKAVMIQSSMDVTRALDVVKRERALEKLTTEERKLLGIK